MEKLKEKCEDISDDEKKNTPQKIQNKFEIGNISQPKKIEKS